LNAPGGADFHVGNATLLPMSVQCATWSKGRQTSDYEMTEVQPNIDESRRALEAARKR
jgi:hypothetical protein